MNLPVRTPIRSILRSQRALAIGVLVLATIGFACGEPGGPPGAVHILTAKGTVGPVMARYIDRGINHAEGEAAKAIVLQLNTPGGLDTSMREIIEDILNADIPVIVYVAPQGARAASAGTFITLAGHVAAMAPNTSIGAAHPVGVGGQEIEGTLGDKVVNDAVAYIKDIARTHGRNEQWAERAVRESISAYSQEAADLGVVDLVAPNLDALLEAVEGRQVSLHDGRVVTLGTATAPRVFNDRNLAEQFLDIISEPNIAFLLLSLGSLALFFELANPGAIFPGVFGVIALILGFFGLTVLPFNWAGLALVLAAFIFLFLEIFITSHGLLGLGGVVSLVLGGLLLTSGNPPEFQVNRWLIYGIAIAIGLYFFFVIMSVARTRRLAPAMGVETIVGREAIAHSPLNRKGFVLFDGEYWSAEAEEESVQPGERVVITAIQGLKLRVRRKPERS